MVNVTNEILLSIIIIGHNIENFIQQSIASCCEDNVECYEVIYIDNGSTDRTVSFAERQGYKAIKNFKVLELESNYGPGYARNVGLDNAAGEYIVFLDGDDFLAPHSIPYLVDLITTKDADLYLYNHCRFHEDGRFVINGNSRNLEEGFLSDTNAWRGFLKNFGVAWNMACRRSLINELELRFSDGFYEDIEWSILLKLMAHNPYITKAVLVNYRHRTGSVLRSESTRHLDVTLAIDRLSSALAVLTPLPNFKSLPVYEYVRGIVFGVLEEKRLPYLERTRFISASHVSLKYLRSVLRLSTVKNFEKALSLRFYPLYIMTRLVTNFILRLRERIGKIYRNVRRFTFLILYNLGVKYLSIDHSLVLMDAYWGKKIDCNPRALAGPLERQGMKVVWSVSEQLDPKLQKNHITVKRGSMKHHYYLAKAKYIVSNVNVVDSYIKKTNQVHLQTFHGTPLKFMGLDLRETVPEEMNWNGYAKRSKRWDFGLSSNSYSTSIWTQNAPYGWKVLETGYPRNDILFNYSKDDIIRIKKELGVETSKKIALYAPTYRKLNERDLKNYKFSEFNADAVLQALGDDYVLLVRGHYFESSSMRYVGDSRIIDVSDYPVANELCIVSDILITDYSSIMFDYACLRRPIVIYAYDYENYRSQRGVYFDLRSEAPGVFYSNFDDLIDGLKIKAFASDRSLKNLKLFCEKFCEFDDGFATQRVLQNVFSIEPDI